MIAQLFTIGFFILKACGIAVLGGLAIWAVCEVVDWLF